MAEPIFSRIQNIQDRIKEIENFSKPRNNPASEISLNKNSAAGTSETFSEMMKEITNAQAMQTNQLLGGDEPNPQSPMQNRVDSMTDLAGSVLNSLKDETYYPQDSYKDIIERAASVYEIDPKLVQAVIRVESNNDPKAVSHKGAQGLMQLMPATAQELGVSDSFDPEENVFGGTRYLKELINRYNGDIVRALAAYNAGPSAVDKAGGIPNFAETRLYVPKVLKLYYKLNREE